MCSVTAGLAVAGAIAGAYGQHQEAKSQAAAARAQADAAEQNAKVERKKQELIANRYAQEDMKRRAQARLNAGHNLATAGQAGLSVTGSSVLDILSSSESAYQNDRNLSIQNQQQDNYVSRQQENNYLSQAAALRNQADNIKKNAAIGIGATILGTAATISGKVGSSGSSYSSTNESYGFTDLSRKSKKVLSGLNGAKTRN